MANSSKNSKHSIAIVGAGIGGSSTAYFLSELFTEAQVSIDIYEAKVVGGRVASDVINGHRFDTGAQVLHEEQKHMAYFRDLLGLEKRKSYISGSSGYFNGKEYFPKNESWAPKITELNKYVDNLLSKFRRIYNFQKEKKSFEDVNSMLQALDPDLPKCLSVSAKEGILKEGFTEDFIDVVVAAAAIRDYQMQTNQIHQFAGTYALGTSQPKLWQIEGGNYLVPQGLVKKSGSNLIPHKVQEVELTADGTFRVTANGSSKTYDFVVIATPITEDHNVKIAFKEFPEKIHVPGHYQRLVFTLVHGKLSPTYFGLLSEEDAPAAVLNIGDSCFSIICQSFPVNSKQGKIKEPYYGLCSKEPIPEQELGKLFTEKHDVHVYDWLANPYYDTSNRNDKFVLHKNLFHISAIEWIASGMEMSCISGKNIALLIYNSVFPQK